MSCKECAENKIRFLNRTQLKQHYDKLELFYTKENKKEVFDNLTKNKDICSELIIELENNK